MEPIQNTNIRIFSDGADLQSMLELNADPLVSGLTTNPTLMRRAGIMDYRCFAKSVLEVVREKPLSLEVTADDLHEMSDQARELNSWGRNVYVKIPITTSTGISTISLIEKLSYEGIKINVTAVLSRAQMSMAASALHPGTPGIISVFCGRIADTLRDPPEVNIGTPSSLPEHEFLWASVREPWNIRQAAMLGYKIVTVPPDILAKARKMYHMDLLQLSLATVQQFKKDAEGYTI